MIKRFWRVPIVVALLACLCILNRTPADSYVPQSSETATVKGVRLDGEKTETSFEIFPKEATYGDFAFVLQRATNVSDKTIKNYPTFDYPVVGVLEAPDTGDWSIILDDNNLAFTVDNLRHIQSCIDLA